MVPKPLRHLRPEDLAGLRWRGLIRESTGRQAERWSPERQRRDIERAAAELAMVPAPPCFYERVGSGEKIAPELDTALADALAGEYDVLIVLTTSRFARNRAEAVRRKAQFAAAGIPIYFVEERLVSGSRMGRLIEGIREVIDEEENEVRRSWIAGGIRERQRAGAWVGRIPFGYRPETGPHGPTGRLEPDPEEAPIVAEIIRLAAEGWRTSQLAAYLNERGIRTKMGGPWRPSTVGRLVANPLYAGRLVRYRRSHPLHYYPEDGPDGRAEYPGPPPIVSPELVARAAAAVGYA